MTSIFSSPQEYTEYTPGEIVDSNNEVTHAKVPYYPDQDSQSSYIPNGQTRYREDIDGTLVDNGSEYGDDDVADIGVNDEVNQVVELFKSLPKDFL